MATDLPPDDPEGEKELFELFRGLRERVFLGSSEIVSQVLRKVEARLQAKPEESFAISVLVQITNFMTSWFKNDEHDDDADDTNSDGDDDA